MEELFTVGALVSFLSLALMEIVLGIDNIIFISILTGKMRPEDQKKGRMIGISAALIVRVLLLFGISVLVGFQKPIFIIDNFQLFGGELIDHFEFSGRDLILLLGGLFLIYKSTTEIHHKLEGISEDSPEAVALPLGKAIIQIILLDVVFSFDSILTAIGLVDDPNSKTNFIIMVSAIVVSMIVMLAAAKSISDFIEKHPTVKMLALSFLLMIGLLLFVESFHVHVPKGYVYFAIFFSLFVEVLNLRLRKKRTKPVELADSHYNESE
ncbi:TerC family protein [Marinigracilibium pacificum]|uniref:TerC family protein n=1 Tax=Marinigracilibium pacificum TaxID=2729599 RepID=A0A848J2K5_9BACT|nr:TerC family protein [Marinigracilibium pacificum]NMM49735.1 TerC family protein [Marinigracilibium pacificum]